MYVYARAIRRVAVIPTIINCRVDIRNRYTENCIYETLLAFAERATGDVGRRQRNRERERICRGNVHD